MREWVNDYVRDERDQRDRPEGAEQSRAHTTQGIAASEVHLALYKAGEAEELEGGIPAS